MSERIQINMDQWSEPVELTANLDGDGSLDSLEILGQNGVRTKLDFLQ